MMKKNTILSLFSILFLISGTLVAQTFTNYTTSNGLPDNNVNGLAIDAGNNKWFGTQNGVARFDGTNWTVYTTADGLIDNYINCISIDQDNHVWVGTDIGVSTFDGSQWSSLTTANGLISDFISYIAPGEAGTVWIGTSGGLSRYDGSTFTNYSTSNGLPSDMISYLATDGSNNLWIGTWLGGLVKFDGSAFTVFTTANGLPDINISCIAIDDADNKFIGSFMGITKLDASDNFVLTYTTDDGLFNNYIKDLAIDSGQGIWAGIYADYLQDGAVNGFDLTEWTTYTTANGLVNPMVKRIAVDQDDHIWIATGNGVSELSLYTGLPEPVAAKVSIQPNPAGEIVYLTGLVSPMDVKIFSVNGQLVEHVLAGPGQEAIDIRNLGAGFYTMQLCSSTNNQALKLVVK